MHMATRIFRMGSLVTAAMLLSSSLAGAQTPAAPVPPHDAGSICLTQSFWCWAQPPGLPGSPCTCPTPFGNAQGQLG